MSSLAGKTCVVTGAANGIGRRTAVHLAELGARVLALDLDGDGLAKLDGVQGVSTFVVDLTSPDAVSAWASTVADVDIHVLFNNVVVVVDGTVLDTDLATWNRSFAVNVTSMYLMMNAVLPKMKSQLGSGGGGGGGRTVINMGSVASSLCGVPRRAAYGATKGAVVGLTKACAVDLLGTGVTCNAICPGPVETDAFRSRRADPDNSDQGLDEYMRTKMIGRLVSEDEVAAAVAYLASDQAASMTGSVLTLDGGLRLFKY